MPPRRVTDRIFQVAGPEVTASYDSAVYLVDLGTPLLIDAGSGYRFRQTVANMAALGYDPSAISMIVLTHCHFDHIGAAPLFQKDFAIPLAMHRRDAAIVAAGDSRLTAAICFKVELRPFPIDILLSGDHGTVPAGSTDLHWIHTPGHTPGSISPYIDIDGKRILFGQDISAPLLEYYDCDPTAWEKSIKGLMDLNADIFCDGHMGPVAGRRRVRDYLAYILAARTDDPQP